MGSLLENANPWCLVGCTVSKGCPPWRCPNGTWGDTVGDKLTQQPPTAPMCAHLYSLVKEASRCWMVPRGIPSGTGEQLCVCQWPAAEPALAFAVTLLLRAGCWPSLENNVTYFGFETRVICCCLLHCTGTCGVFQLVVPVLSQKLWINASPACQISTFWRWYSEK